MNYQRIYDLFIADRREKEDALKSSGVYCERHHIVPVLNGRDDSPANIIYLTAGDHFFAHLCLAKAHGGRHWKAVEALVNLPGSSKRRDLIPARWWVEKARAESAKFHSEKAKVQHARHGLSEKANSPEARAKKAATLRQYIHWTNGERNIRLKEQDTPPEGFRRGRTFFNKSGYQAPEYKKLLSERSKTLDRSYMTGDGNFMNRMTPEERLAWREKMREVHNRPEVRAKKGFAGDRNVMRSNPEAKAKMMASRSVYAQRKAQFIVGSGYSGNRRLITKVMVDTWFSNLPET